MYIAHRPAHVPMSIDDSPSLQTFDKQAKLRSERLAYSSIRQSAQYTFQKAIDTAQHPFKSCTAHHSWANLVYNTLSACNSRKHSHHRAICTTLKQHPHKTHNACINLKQPPFKPPTLHQPQAKHVVSPHRQCSTMHNNELTISHMHQPPATHINLASYHTCCTIMRLTRQLCTNMHRLVLNPHKMHPHARMHRLISANLHINAPTLA